MNLIFRRADNKHADFWDRIIMAATGGPWVHTEIQFNDGRFFSSRAPRGVGFLESIDLANTSQWETLVLPWPETPAIIRWAESIVGQAYDYVGAISSGTGMDVHLSKAWFCSETSIEIISRAGVVGLSPLLSPTALHRVITSILHGKPVRQWDLMANPFYHWEVEKAVEDSADDRQWATSIEEWNLVVDWRSKIRKQSKDLREISSEIQGTYFRRMIP